MVTMRRRYRGSDDPINFSTQAQLFCRREEFPIPSPPERCACHNKNHLVLTFICHKAPCRRTPCNDRSFSPTSPPSSPLLPVFYLMAMYALPWPRHSCPALVPCGIDVSTLLGRTRVRAETDQSGLQHRGRQGVEIRVLLQGAALGSRYPFGSRAGTTLTNFLLFWVVETATKHEEEKLSFLSFFLHPVFCW